MLMPAPVRKLGLLAHILASVGWLGAVLVSLGLAVVGLSATDGDLVRSAYLVMETLGWTTLVPLSFLSLATGLVQALGTRWGLLRHYWVVVKLVMNLFAMTILLLYMRTLAAVSAAARSANGADAASLRDPSPALHSGAALVLLVVAAALAVYKPPGRTRYGQRRVPT
jgi:hypothetical protein